MKEFFGLSQGLREWVEAIVGLACIAAAVAAWWIFA